MRSPSCAKEEPIYRLNTHDELNLAHLIPQRKINKIYVVVAQITPLTLHNTTHLTHYK